MEPTRLVLYAKDLMQITGKSRTAVWRIQKMIRERSGKKDCSFVTVEDFCEFTGLSEEKVRALIR
jgi:hypothetical protein